MRMFWMPTEKTVRIEETNIRQPNKKKEARKIHWKKKKILEKKMGYKFLRTTTKREKLLC